jgi:hypothetical protein
VALWTRVCLFVTVFHVFKQEALPFLLITRTILLYAQFHLKEIQALFIQNTVNIIDI